jgi:hypothetical protein
MSLIGFVEINLALLDRMRARAHWRRFLSSVKRWLVILAIVNFHDTLTHKGKFVED